MSNHERGGPGSIPQRPSPDDALDRAWRDASDEQPPTQLDAAILAAARTSIAERRGETAAAPIIAPAPRVRAPSRFTRWQPLAVAASVAGLAFVLVQTLPREPEFSPPSQSQESVSIPAASPAAQASVPLEKNTVSAHVARELDHQPQRAEARDLAPAQRAVPAPPHEANASTPVAEAATSSDGAAAAPSSDRAAVATSSNGAAAATEMAAVAAPARDSAAKASQRLDATDWAASIEAQYAAGDLAGAAARLRAFRAIDPEADQYLPDTLRAWARSVE